MNRRSFLSTLVGGVAVAAAQRTWPFRVYSFGSEPRLIGGDPVIVPIVYKDFKRYVFMRNAHDGIVQAWSLDERAYWRKRGYEIDGPEMLYSKTIIDAERKEFESYCASPTREVQIVGEPMHSLSSSIFSPAPLFGKERV